METLPFKIEVIKERLKEGMQFETVGSFIRLTHEESGIIVTKYNKYQYKALAEATKEIEMLVEIWKNK